MSTSPSFPFNNDLADRPLSVYDNLTNQNHIANGGNKEYPKPTQITNGDPLKNITFKFDDCEVTSNGGTSYTPGNNNSFGQALPSSIKSSPAKSLIGSSSPPPEVNNGNNIDSNKISQGLAIAATVSPTKHELLACETSPPRSVTIGSNTKMSDPVSSYDSGSSSNYKPVISDAKSRFFGLTTAAAASSEQSAPNGYRSDFHPLLNDSNSTCNRQVQISPPGTLESNVLEHKYQNIPSNSAIFRKINDPSGKNASDVSDSTASTMPAIVTTDLSAPENNISLSENSKFGSDDDGQSDRQQKTNSFHADTDLNYNQQPSQVIYMSTTVPQNIKSPNIAGRHTPTRNSLRHSRMLVVNKNYQGLPVMNPLGLKHPKLARILLIILLILGLLITSIGIWILLWAPYTRMQDNPYWSGLSLILAGTLGLIVLKFKRIKRQKIREHCFTFLKVDSMMLTTIACILCLIAFTCASLHLNSLYSPTTKCTSTNIFIANASCICIFGAKDTNFTPPSGVNMTNRTEEGEEFFAGGYEFHYKDLSCSEVNGAWRYLLMSSIVLNVLGFFVASTYIFLACLKRKDKRKLYNSVRTDVF